MAHHCGADSHTRDSRLHQDLLRRRHHGSFLRSFRRLRCHIPSPRDPRIRGDREFHHLGRLSQLSADLSQPQPAPLRSHGRHSGVPGHGLRDEPLHRSIRRSGLSGPRVRCAVLHSRILSGQGDNRQQCRRDTDLSVHGHVPDTHRNIRDIHGYRDRLRVLPGGHDVLFHREVHPRHRQRDGFRRAQRNAQRQQERTDQRSAGRCFHGPDRALMERIPHPDPCVQRPDGHTAVL